MTVKLAMSILVRDEIDLIRENILFHIAQGIEHFVVTDNGSVDGTREVLEDLSTTCNLHIIDEKKHTIDQDIWVTKMADWLRTNTDCTWVINNDADEFWRAADSSLPNALECELTRTSSNNIGVLYCDRYNYLPSTAAVKNANYRFYDNVYRVVEDKDSGSPASVNNVLITRQEHKVITKLDGLRLVTMGNHGADHNLESTKSTTIQIAHYPLRSYQQFEKKVNNHGASVSNNTRFGPGINWHLRYWYDLLTKGQLKQEYDKYVLTNQQIQSLTQEGVIEHDAELRKYLHKLDSRPMEYATTDDCMA